MRLARAAALGYGFLQAEREQIRAYLSGVTHIYVSNSTPGADVSAEGLRARYQVYRLIGPFKPALRVVSGSSSSIGSAGPRSLRDLEETYVQSR
eukprot:scaffold256_cov261-Pinguiococcus_pyrenoidosus.AAC.18